jgi:hypothetical protein
MLGLVACGTHPSISLCLDALGGTRKFWFRPLLLSLYCAFFKSKSRVGLFCNGSGDLMLGTVIAVTQVFWLF